MRKKLGIGFAVLFSLLLTAFYTAAAESAKKALRLCAELIVPSLFPFFVFSVLMNRLGLPEWLGKRSGKMMNCLFGVSGAGGSALFIGLLGGYPMGAAYIADMVRSGKLEAAEAERLLTFCNNPGPAFILGAVGVGVFGDIRVGLRLYAVQVIAAMLCGIFFSLRKERSRESSPMSVGNGDELSRALPEAVKTAVGSVLNVCGFVVFFSVLLGVLDGAGRLSRLCLLLGAYTGLGSDFIRSLLCGITELGSGMAAMRALRLSPRALSLASFLLGFGGLSVLCQTSAVLSDAKLKGALHLKGRLLTACIAALLSYSFGIVLM